MFPDGLFLYIETCFLHVDDPQQESINYYNLQIIRYFRSITFIKNKTCEW